MLVDTGAARTLVDDRVAQGLGLTPIRFDPIVGVSGVAELHPVYRMAMSLEMEDAGGRGFNAEFCQDIVGMKPQTGAHGYGLIGRDFLSYVRLSYDGRKGTFALLDDHHLKSNTADKKREKAREKARTRRKGARKSKRRNRGR